MEKKEPKVKTMDTLDKESEVMIFKNTLIFLDRVREIKGINENAAYAQCVLFFKSKTEGR